jgi:hypothetical protein
VNAEKKSKVKWFAALLGVLLILLGSFAYLFLFRVWGKVGGKERESTPEGGTEKKVIALPLIDGWRDLLAERVSEEEREKLRDNDIVSFQVAMISPGGDAGITFLRLGKNAAERVGLSKFFSPEALRQGASSLDPSLSSFLVGERENLSRGGVRVLQEEYRGTVQLGGEEGWPAETLRFALGQGPEGEQKVILTTYYLFLFDSEDYLWVGTCSCRVPSLSDTEKLDELCTFVEEHIRWMDAG